MQKYKIIAGAVVIICILLTLSLVTNLKLETIVLIIFPFFILYLRLTPAILTTLSMVCLLLIPILLILLHFNFPYIDIAAERLAVWSVYLLIISVIAGVWENIKIKNT